ncbi:acyl esterase [Sansalvadorimonas sp. 2012CJ34-2]|uniref:Acyl esterase n=1 Tax=Parendozoicomonas callyspongiae TaxID=2942213 RepID=A0ABT0PF12_9GAMM|nr:alpha/beta fold hydrolase [Sansalvadorimonas sp. 2012CJ34-2]MCL6269905.1 acyl esterase [Sansalvadorimonas sp. 2012CJ34-2]
MKSLLRSLSFCVPLVFTLMFTQAAQGDIKGLFNFAAGLLNHGVFPESELYTTDDDIIITASDGVELAANIFVPTNLSGSAPAVIFINSWGLNEYQYLSQAAQLAEKGYIVLSYSTRGFGTSGGQIATAGPQDIDDYSQAITFLINNYPVNPDAIGTAGISYGSGISLMGAAQDKRVKAIAAMSSWGSLTEALYGNQTPRLAWAEILTLISETNGNPDPIIEANWKIIKNQDLDNIPEVLKWAEARSPINYVDRLNQNGTAVYLAKAYGDNLFQPNSLLELYQKLNTPKHLDLLPGTHATAELLPSLLGVGENIVWENVYKWFDIHLKDISNDLESAKPLQMKVKFQNRFEGFESYPVETATSHTFYMHPRSLFDNGDLENHPYRPGFGREKENTINAWFGTLFSTQIPVLSQLLEQLEIPVITNIYAASRYRGIYFNTPKLNKTLEIRGTPRVTVQVQPHFNKVQLVGYLYDMDWSGTARLITHGVTTLPNASSGENVALSFDLVATAYDVPEGHRLVLAFDTRDPQYQTPTSKNYSLDFEFSDTKQSILTVPAL